MPRGSKISPELVEKIKAHYAMTGNLAKTAKEFGVSSQTVMKYRDQEPDKLEELRTYNKELYIKDAWKTLGLLFESLPDKIKGSPLREVTTAIGIITDKVQLLNGDPTSRSDNTNKNTHDLGELTLGQAEELIKAYMKGGSS